MAKKSAKKRKVLGKRTLKRTKGGQGTITPMPATPLGSQDIVSPYHSQKLPGTLKDPGLSTGLTSASSTSSVSLP